LTTNKKIILKNTPVGVPEKTDFEIAESSLPEIGENEMITKTIHLSLDPYIRGVITGRHIYSEKVDIGDTIVGRTVSEVITSNHPNYNKGDIVVCSNGWQEYGVTNGEGVRKLDPFSAPLSTALGILGMPGLTAYAGLLVYGEPKENDLIVITDDELKLKQVHDLIVTHFVRRKVDSLCLSQQSKEKAGGNKIRQSYKLVEGIEQTIAKKITADVKSSKIKVQVKINGNELRVDGKKKDDLQTVMQMIEEAKIGIPVQFVNYRD